MKRTVKNTATDQMLFTGGTTSSDTGFLALDFNSSDKLRLSSAATNFLITTAVYRDSGAWMHIVLAFDATQGTNANKAELYVNGTEVTVFDTDGRSSISNQDYGVNQAAAHETGRASLGSNKYLDGYLADVHFIDGQALEPTAFGAFDSNGDWQKIPYEGTYGTNGFHLPFTDNSTAAALGTDTSGNGNTWTPNNFSVAAGAGNDSVVDSPTNYGTDSGAGGEVRGNYCTLNPLKYGGDIQAPTNGNLDVTSLGSATGKILGTIGVSSGKWYWECVPNSSANIAFGITKDNTVLANYPGQDAVDYTYHNDGSKYSNNSGSAYGATYTTNDVIGVAFDADNGTLTFYKNNSSQGQAYSGLTSGPYFPLVGDPSSTPDISATANFGQRPFAYTAPAGFKALCTQNLPTPTIANGATAMDVKLYTGNGSTQTISGLNFSPDFVWYKQRNGIYGHDLFDIVRGTGNILNTNNTLAEYSEANRLTAFNSDGFSLGSNAAANGSGSTYVAWTWDAGSSTVSNTDGSITSNVRANASAGFSIVTWTRASTADNIGHGLGVAPSFIICKSRTSTIGWMIGHVGLDPTSPWNYRIFFDTDARNPDGATSWNGVPTSSVFYTGNTGYIAGDMVAYCFAPVAGYSSFGSYTGNGSADGTFVYTGFSPRWLMVKRTNSTENWYIIDTARDTYNISGLELYPNLSNAESTGFGNLSILDVVSNGFKFRATNPGYNASSSTYIYAAFAESPFKTSRAR